MEKTSNVQLHKIIKNSLASYLSYKWSKNKLYLKKRKNKARREKANKEKASTKLEKKHSIINLENDIFIYDAQTKTFTQLDLCDCFRNGLKYRKLDPFKTHTTNKKYELHPRIKDSSEDTKDFKHLQLTDLEDSVEQIFSNHLVKKSWGKTLKGMSPSKFDLFIQKELNKYNGKNINVQSMNSKENLEKEPKNNLQSTAAVGYYKITFDDTSLKCDSKTKIDKVKRISFADKKKNQFNSKKMHGNDLQYEHKKNHHRASKREEEKFSTRNETGVQCVLTPQHNTEEKKNVDLIESQLVEMTQHKKTPHLRQKSHNRKKTLRRRPSSMIRINSSAEIRKMLNEKRSSPSFTLSSTGEYFRTLLQQHPRTLLTYYQTSSTSRENAGDTYDEHYFKNQHVVVATTSNPISPICSGPCGTKHRAPPAKSPCTCTCGTTYENAGRPKRNITESDKRSQEVQYNDVVDVHEPENQNDDGSLDAGGPILTKTVSVQKQTSVIMRDPEFDRPKSHTVIRSPSQSKSIDAREARLPSSTRVTYSQQNMITDANTGEVIGMQTIDETKTRSLCTKRCADPCNVRKSKSVCSCCNQKIKQCCECPPDPSLKSKCICDILTCLKEKIKLQTAEQNRNLDQILEELNKQDRELKEIRNFVEKYNALKTKEANKSINKIHACTCYPEPKTKEANKSKNKVDACSCYAVTVQQGFTTDMKPLPDTFRAEEVREGNSVQVQQSKSSEPEIIEIFGSTETFNEAKTQNRILKKDSWKALWNRNSEVKAFFVTDMLKKRSIQKRYTSSSNTTTDDLELKKMKRHWFSQLFTSKKDLRKSAS